MIATGDITNILYSDCEAFGIQTFCKGNIPKGELISERIIIRPKEIIPDKIWEKCFVEINLCVPDIALDEANSIRLAELERLAKKKFKSATGMYDDTVYHYSYSSVSTEGDSDMKCHFVNIKVLFKILNVK